jgi:hypothetical protein
VRARELLQEDYNQNLESDLTNLLVAAKGNGAQQVETQSIVDQLYGMGYAIDVNSILPLLGNNPAVMNATPEMITMTSPEGGAAGQGSADQDSASMVSDMASKASSLG